MSEARWQHYDHGADIGVRGMGRSKAEAFEQAALALTAVMFDPAGIRGSERVRVTCEAPDDELLLADWLNALIYRMTTRNLALGRFRVRIDGHRLAGEARGEKLDPARHRAAVEVKGATYTTLRVAQEPDGTWIAQTVVDV